MREVLLDERGRLPCRNHETPLLMCAEYAYPMR
jgi:hypothetical protein